MIRMTELGSGKSSKIQLKGAKNVPVAVWNYNNPFPAAGFL